MAAGEGNRADEKFDAAITIYKSHGFATEWVDRVIAEKTRGVEPLTVALSGQHHGSTSGEKGREVVFKQEGEYWTIAYEGRVFRLKDIKGMSYIAHLLSHPDKEFYSLDLVRGRSVRGSRPTGSGSGDTGGAFRGTWRRR